MSKVSRSLKELNMKIEMLRKQYEKEGKELTIEKIKEELILEHLEVEEI